MNILIITYIFYPEPIAMSTIIKDIAVELCNKGHRVKVVTSKPCRPYGYAFSNEVDESRWPFKREILSTYNNPKSELVGRCWENRSFGKAARRYINQNHKDIDVVYACAFPLFAQKMIVDAAQKYAIPVVMHVEDIYPEPLIGKIPCIGSLVYRVLLPIDRYLLQRSTKVVAIAPNIRHYLIKSRKLDPSKVEFVYNWQNEKKFEVHTTSSKSPQFTFMYLGSLSRAANLAYLVKCFIEANLKNARFVFAGSGIMKKDLMELTKYYKASNIEFVDAKGELVSTIQSSADVLVLPLRKGIALRAFPSKFPAYLFSGKPVLAIVDGESDIANSIKQAKCGWVVEPDQQNELVEIMRGISKMDRLILEEMGKSGEVYGKANLSTEVNLKKIVSIILSVKECIS